MQQKNCMSVFKKRSKSSSIVPRPAVNIARAEKRVLLFKRIGALTVLLLCIGGVGMASQRIFTVQRVQCQVAATACPADIESRLSNLPRHRLLGHDFTTTINTVLADTAFRVASWQIRLPGTLVIELSQDPALYELTTADARVFVSRTGVVTTAPEESTQELLTVTTSHNLEDLLQNDGSLQENYHNALTLLAEAVTTKKLPVSAVAWDDQTVQLTLPENFRIVFLISDVPSQLERATLVLDSPEFAARTAELSILDLRFRLPVLRNSL